MLGVGLFACDDPNVIGLDLPGSARFTISNDSIQNFETSTISEDNLRSDESLHLLLGQINDPIFGLNQGGFITQMLLPSNNISEISNVIVDSVIDKICKQKYIKRRNYIFHISDQQIVNNFNNKYLQVCFSSVIRASYNFEKIIFQMQLDGSMIVILHCSYIDYFFDTNFNEIIILLCEIFVNHQNFVLLVYILSLEEDVHMLKLVIS